MKSTINDDEPDYPYLGILHVKQPCESDDQRVIVLFCNYATGTVVYTESKDHPLAMHSADWLEHEFSHFIGTTRLSNE